eukprot:scaffold1626_cov372-Prasinococcus_capsulatus_cf.AAC.8
MHRLGGATSAACCRARRPPQKEVRAGPLLVRVQFPLDRGRRRGAGCGRSGRGLNGSTREGGELAGRGSSMVNWQSFRFSFEEASGALGDLGTFLPWLIALAVNNG